jgi:hypothetical protein
MKPLGMDETCAVGKNQVLNMAASPRSNHAAAIDLCANRDITAGAQSIERNKRRPVLIGLGNVEKKILDSAYVAGVEKRCPARSDALYELDVGVEAEHG